MIIQQVVIQNFGLYKGEHTINLGNKNNNSSKVITLIGGLNGRGKTTFLDAIILGLYGRRALKYLQDERMRYTTYIENHVSKGVPAGSQTKVQLTLLEAVGDDNSITICRSWDKKLVGVSDERLIAYRNGTIDEALSNNWDYYVEEILPLTISRFFFFDNEKIAQIADDETFAQIKDSIRALLGFTTIDQLIADMGRLAKRFSQHEEDNERCNAVRKLEEIQQEIETIQKDAKVAYDNSHNIGMRIKQLYNRFEEENERFWQNGGKLGLERDKLESEKKAITESITQYMNMVRDYTRDSATPLLLCRNLLVNVSKQQEESERIRTHYYYEMFVSHVRQQLTEKNGYSSELIAGIIEVLEKVANMFGTDGKESLPSETFTSETFELIQNVITDADQRKKNISMLLANLAEEQNRKEQIELHLSREINEHETKQARQVMTEISDQIISLEVEKRMAEERVLQYERDQDRLTKKRAQLIENSLQTRLGNSESERIVKYANIVIQTMEIFKKNLLEQKLQELSERILSCFRSMVKKASMIQRIVIDPTTLDINLVDYLGGELLKTQLSAGEKQLFAISIIWGLAKCSGYDMPVIIDTPLARLDSQHRINFVEGYLPYAGKQVIVLSTDEEIYGKYYELIRPFIGNEYTLVYSEDTKSTSIKEGYQWGNTYDRKAD